MCGGGSAPKVDTSYQDYSIAEAERARAEEEARQNKVNLGMENIKAIFEGGRGVGVASPTGEGYNPNQTYYLQDGSVWTPEDQKTRTRTVTSRTPVAASARAPKTGPAYRVGTPEYKARLLEEYRARQRAIGNTTITNPRHKAEYGGAYPADIARGTVNRPQYNTSTKTITEKYGPTAAEQFAKIFGDLNVAGKGEKYGGIDSILDERRTAAQNYYLPQLDKQYGDTRDDLTFALARSGLLNSTTAEERKADLNEGFNLERAGIFADIDRDVASAAGRLQQQRAAIESSLRASGDAESAIDAALTARSTFAQDQPDLSPLTSTLQGFAQGIGAAQSGLRTADIRQRAAGSTVNNDTGFNNR